MASQPTHPETGNATLAHDLRQVADWFEAHPWLPTVRWAVVSLRALNDERPARETLELLAAALDWRAQENVFLGDIDILGNFGQVEVRATASFTELDGTSEIQYDPILPVHPHARAARHYERLAEEATALRAEHDSSLCGCGPEWRKPRPNGTCATCGGWLPGEKPPSLTALWAGEPGR